MKCEMDQCKGSPCLLLIVEVTPHLWAFTPPPPLPDSQSFGNPNLLLQWHLSFY